MLLEFVGGFDESIDELPGIERYIAGDVVIDFVEVPFGVIRPENSHERDLLARNLRFISS